jgi:hypothetical protein
MAFGAGWQSRTEATRAALATMNAASAVEDQSRTFGEPFNKSVSGCRVRATAGRKRL